MNIANLLGSNQLNDFKILINGLIFFKFIINSFFFQLTADNKFLEINIFQGNIPTNFQKVSKSMAG